MTEMSMRNSTAAARIPRASVRFLRMMGESIRQSGGRSISLSSRKRRLTMKRTYVAIIGIAAFLFCASAALTGTLTLNFQGNPNAFFLFKIGSTLTTASASSIVLTNTSGTCAPNVYWQIGSSATLGTGSSFLGNILALTTITMTTGGTLNGRALARNGAVTLDTNTLLLASATDLPALGHVSLTRLIG